MVGEFSPNIPKTLKDTSYGSRFVNAENNKTRNNDYSLTC
ncbi:hypothetical protein P20311_2308 [Pseudoalteromonas sp. BSi20311]|nr:hypothetical protein P20311_2308 [Pseudoalteromonas sp. BSi20311]GAA72349.1 hypothetical protein P20439_2437 [Pseudoalteromonas sp. BSi20439]